jgi:predicted nucleic-acid-binding protein
VPRLSRCIFRDESLEKLYKFGRRTLREIFEAILNTPELKIEMESVFRRAVRTYEEKNIKFADAVMGYWGLKKILLSFLLTTKRTSSGSKGLKSGSRVNRYQPHHIP